MASEHGRFLNESQLMSLLEYSPNTYLILDSRGTVIDAYAGKRANSQFLPCDPRNRKVYDFLPPAAAAVFYDTFTKVRDTLEETSTEFIIKSGEDDLFFEAGLTPLDDGRIIAAVRDITSLKKVEARSAELIELNRALRLEVSERKQAEAALKQRTDILTALLEVSHHVASTLELEPLLGIILDHLKLTVEYNAAAVLLLEGDNLVTLAYRGPEDLKDLSLRRYSSGSKLARETISGRKSIVIPDVSADTELARDFRELAEAQQDKTLGSVRAWICVPLIVKDKVIGGLTIHHYQAGYYGEGHKNLAEAFANQVAVAIENAELYAETRRRADELQTMFAVQLAISSRLDLEAVIRLIADEAKRLTNSKRTAVFLLEGDYLKLSVISGDNEPDLLGYKMPVDRTLTGLSLKTGNPVRINKTEDEPRLYSDIIIKAGIKSFISAPMLSGSQPVGAITVVDKLTGSFTAGDERILAILASIAVIGLENARLYKEEQERRFEAEQRRQVAEGLRDILAVLNSNRPLSDILDYILTQAGRLLGTDTAALYRLQPGTDILRIEAARGLPEEYMEGMSVKVGEGVVGRAVVGKQPVIIEDMTGLFPAYFSHDTLEDRFLSWLGANFRGIIAVPLIAQNEVYGGIVLYFPEARTFSEDEMELALSFAGQAVLAIDNAVLRAKAGEMAVAAERSRLARDLHDAVTQTLFSASLIAEVLPRIWERNPGEVMKRLEELRQLSRGALAEMRTLLLELRPSTLVESGLGELLGQLAEAVTGRTRIPVKLHIDGKPCLPPEVKIAFYRIAQEALNNISKHSGAREAVIKLSAGITSEGREMAELVITDDGKGFNAADIPANHLGIGIMRERAEASGANLTIKSAAGLGTEISVCWGNEGEEN